MSRTLIVAALAALGLALLAGVAQRALAQQEPQEEVKPEEKAPAPHPHVRHGGMAVKPVVCRVVPEAQGKAGQELANAIEGMAAQFHRSNYRLAALLPGDPPIACFSSNSDPSKLPMGAR
jgi:hypothetical protein